jgi:acetylglutamate kinase
MTGHPHATGTTMRAASDSAAIAAAQAKAATLVEALPWLEQLPRRPRRRQVRRQRDDRRRSLQEAFAQDIAFLRFAGLRVVVVHGGGPQIKAMLTRLGIPSEFKGGLRVTTPEVMDVVRMVLTGQVGRELVGLLNQHGPIAVGLSGEDAGALRGAASRRRHRRRRARHRPRRGGRAGRPDRCPGPAGAGRIPVVSTIAPDLDTDGQVLNVNADTAAAALAAALGARKLVVLTDVEGVYAELARPGEPAVLDGLSAARARRLLTQSTTG